jgi:hypothetical protein
LQRLAAWEPTAQPPPAAERAVAVRPRVDAA